MPRLLSACNAAIRRAASTALLFSALASAAQRFPYVQTTILIPEFTGQVDNTSDVAYIFRPTDDNKVELLSLDITETIDGGTSLTTLSSDLPFLKDASDTTAFLPSVADNGTIIVQAGDCNSSGDYGVWTYNPSDLTNDASEDPGTWHKLETTVSSSDSIQVGPNFLGAAISYSSTLAPELSEPILYAFGGMCSSSDSDASTWQAGGIYSNQMVKLARGDSQDGYTASFPSGRGPSFPEAGFSFTPLSPSITNRSDTMMQQRTYLMLGGHTDTAFINMSRAAVWSLPEESWSFLSINEEPGDDRGIELAVKAVSERSTIGSVDSRSGHTATLNEDGNALIIYGGWVGSISQPAEPQLAILTIGDSFGDWSWRVPDNQPDGPGIYGHGAALLPGNIMMIYGGYEISESNSKVKRQQSGDSPRFFNLTSMSWASSYTNPSYSSAEGTKSSPDDSDSNNSENMKRIGLGVGIGVGSAAILGAILVWFCYRRRQRKRQDRDSAVQSLAQDASRFLHGDDEMMEREDNWPGSAWYTGGHDPYDNGVRSLGYQTLRESRNNLGGYGGPPPFDLNIPRKPIPRVARGGYQPAGSLSGSGRIHPIIEADEDDHDEAGHNRELYIGPATPTTPTYSDPFATPTSGIASATAAPVFFPPNRAALTPSPDRIRQMDPEVENWQTDVDAAEVLLAQMPARHRNAAATGRVSPTRRASMRSARSNTPGILGDDERTASGLSESNRSVLSTVSRSGSNPGKAQSPFRASPTATGALLLGGAVASAAVNNDGRLGTSGSTSSSSANTYSTAKTNFQSLQAEGPSLLQRGERGHHRGSSYPQGDDEDEFMVPGSPSKSKPRRQLNWLGSIRRVFSVGGRGNNSNSSGISSRSISPVRRASLDGFEEGSNSYEPRSLGLSGIGGAELLRRKQGRKAWDEQEDSLGEKPPTDKVEDDWDIERAIEKRLVQVMFTVPKERLRVVNGDENDADHQSEEAVLVDPEKEAVASIRRPVDEEKQAMFERDVSTPEPLRINKKRSTESQMSMDLKTAHHPPPPESIPTPPTSTEPIIRAQKDDDDIWSPVAGRALRVPSTEEAGRLSPGPSPRADSFADDVSVSLSEPRRSMTIHTAEAVRFERPKTRVLAMVESFETKSRESSPSKSPRSPRRD